MNITTINNENCNSSTQRNIFGLRKKSADGKRQVIEYVINEGYCNQINQAYIYHKMDVVQLFTSAWILYKNLVTGNNPESIALVNNKNSVILASLIVNHEQTMEKYLDMASEYLSKVNEQTESGNSHSTNSPDILLYSLYSECCVYDREGYDLTIGISQNNGKIKIIYEFNSESISKQMLDLTHKRIMKICEQMSKKKQNYLNEITFLDDFELNLVLHEFNNSDDLYPNTKTIIELFEEQVVKTPNNIALEYEGQTLTYKQLNIRVNYLGELLREQGVKSDSIVGIITKRSIEMVIGIYGVLKAGGAYLPIDPSLPIDRIRFMLNDSGTNVLLEGTESRHITKDLQNINVVDLCECKGEKEQNLKLISKPNNLAYVIYTSGTTGTPKGVMVENGNVVNLVTWMLKNEYHESEVILQKTTFTFDLSIWEFFVGYLAGAKLVLLPVEDEMDPSKIAEQIKKHHVTRTSFVPSVLEGFTSYVNSEVTQSLRKIQLSGEALPVELANRFNQICNGKVGLINSYGPTETTVFATSLDVPTDFNLDFVHIGRPISNTKIYILNGNRLCGIGMMGELCIGGEGVSRGYLNRPELTAEKFVENPFCEGEKIYRTGDLARWMEDGNIEYLGRIDEQVKIRGYRIEIDEVVSEIRNLQEIQNAVVIAREENNDKYLCGYVVGNGKLDSNIIKEQLRKKLPEYMIPAYIIQIESLPITRNGKLDKKALPKPEVISMVEYIAPRNDIEICIAKAFQDILGTDRIGIDDNFFELGGHSLRATKLVNVIEQELGVRIPLREVLTGNTVRNIAEKVRDATNYTYYTSIELQPQKDSYEMSSAQKRLFIIDQMKEGNISYNIPTVLKLKGSLNLEQLNKALKQLCERHQILRTHFNYDQHKFLQMIEDSVDINLEYVEENEGNIQKVLTEFIRPFDLKKAPLMRVKAVKIAEDETILMLDIHHIIYDDGSKGVLLGDLSRFYNGEELPELNAQYKDFSAWQNAKDLGSQGEYWLKEFSDDIPVLDLRTDYPRPQHQSYKGNSFTTTLSNELKNAVNGMSTKTGATQYMILLSSFMLLLSRYSRQEDVVIGSPIAGRIHPDTQNMLGMFANTLAIKGKIGSNSTFIELLEQMKEKCLKAYENQEYPFEELVDKLELERDLSRNPLFDVMFVFQNNEEAELKLGDTILSPVKFTSKSSTFDLTVSMEETADGYELNWEYCTDLFKQETIERMSEHFAVVLTDAVQNPEKLLSEMNMISEQEKEKVLYTFNATEAEYPKDKTI
ncbi:non-ribosomal peptide synthetase, partial [Lysinibacillus sp. FJAT-14745]|uniref:non-ribosomal peptide synthetase n=1 Tax=Lysinibacillus sp. FJAT-14745 TaxID=1704289 RepID=UPI0018F87AC5